MFAFFDCKKLKRTLVEHVRQCGEMVPRSKDSVARVDL